MNVIVTLKKDDYPLGRPEGVVILHCYNDNELIKMSDRPGVYSTLRSKLKRFVTLQSKDRFAPLWSKSGITLFLLEKKGLHIAIQSVIYCFPAYRQAGLKEQ